MNRDSSAPIEKLDVSVYVIPTDSPEADGTAEWDSTTVATILIGHHFPGQVAGRDATPIYGGGFTTSSNARLQEELGGWEAQCIVMVEMKNCATASMAPPLRNRQRLPSRPCPRFARG